jgi:hypothetical protein
VFSDPFSEKFKESEYILILWDKTMKFQILALFVTSDLESVYNAQYTDMFMT